MQTIDDIYMYRQLNATELGNEFCPCVAIVVSLILTT